jgi:hypothetical protein
MNTRSWTDCTYALSIELEDAQSLLNFESWLQDCSLCYCIQTITDEESDQQLIEFQVDYADVGRCILEMQVRWPLLACVLGELDEPPENSDLQALHYIDLFLINDGSFMH